MTKKELFSEDFCMKVSKKQYAAVVTLLISVPLFIMFVLSPLVLGFVSYGIFNALGHNDGKPVYNWLIGILSAGEGHHDVHHANPGQVQLSKYDFAGLVAKKLFI